MIRQQKHPNAHAARKGHWGGKSKELFDKPRFKQSNDNDSISTCSTARMSNLNPNRYTSEEARSRIQALFDAFDPMNLDLAVSFALILLVRVRASRRVEINVSEVLAFVAQPITQVSELLQDAAISVCIFFQQHHSEYGADIKAIIFSLGYEGQPPVLDLQPGIASAVPLVEEPLGNTPTFSEGLAGKTVAVPSAASSISSVTTQSQKSSSLFGLPFNSVGSNEVGSGFSAASYDLVGKIPALDDNSQNSNLMFGFDFSSVASSEVGPGFSAVVEVVQASPNGKEAGIDQQHNPSAVTEKSASTLSE